MRLIRLGAEPTQIGVDVRAALSTWGTGDSVLGGVAMLGVTPPDCPRTLDAVIVLPRGVLVVVGVDLPDPAMRLEAPLAGQWRIDGWPLTRPDGATSPAAEALAATTAVARRIQDMRGEPLPVTTVVAVGPYVAHVVQPTGDLNRGVRVLHPKPTTLLAAARELATSDRPCSAEHAAKLLAVLAPTGIPPDTRQLRAEGFPDAAADLASASTMLLPKVPPAPRRPRWLPYAAAGVVAVLLVVGLVVTLTSGGESAATQSASSTPQPTTVVVDGRNFTPKGADRSEDCAKHAFGDVQVWLSGHMCMQLRRAQYETVVDGRKVGVAVSELNLPDAARAGELRQVASAAGSGGVTALVKDGRTWPGGPVSFDRSAIRTATKTNQVRIAQVVWAEGESDPADPALTALADQALRLPSTQ
ncbi:hypothetical protein ABZ816_28200 [Actinosynnema sp. NPDC047251]|uniref:NERD domain-containing protein n=1 Tax=Saccharothrix espanaensis (strain ATCC 51144 / DSM 44229 / JCM 9112 / NBRC 15066 / NRRL 15764) TaxID=1179773 RepID=K0JXC1_SACES|nr:hypothetical protein [Saccharothrix espanaensis]CCH28888.1 hypothetical protein BN6_15650 [Saccharothrix espanaensis DSM 44229]